MMKTNILPPQNAHDKCRCMVREVSPEQKFFSFVLGFLYYNHVGLRFGLSLGEAQERRRWPPWFVIELRFWPNSMPQPTSAATIEKHLPHPPPQSRSFWLAFVTSSLLTSHTTSSASARREKCGAGSAIDVEQIAPHGRCQTNSSTSARYEDDL